MVTLGYILKGYGLRCEQAQDVYPILEVVWVYHLLG
jgi:hypothetical protein